MKSKTVMQFQWAHPDDHRNFRINATWYSPWRPSFACNLFASIDWAYVFSWCPMHVGRR